jgi:competence protein ComEC
MGGETSPLQQVLLLCRHKLNTIYLSHWDSDHIGFVPSAARALPRACLASPPKGPGRARQLARLKALLPCPIAANAPQVFALRDHVPAVRNDSHVVVSADHRWLIPGDSPLVEERRWITEALPWNQIKTLVLGHHGSRTSSGTALLRTLPNLQIAIASARHARYGHPHRETIARLRAKGLGVLKTEDFGHLRFQE